MIPNPSFHQLTGAPSTPQSGDTSIWLVSWQRFQLCVSMYGRWVHLFTWRGLLYCISRNFCEVFIFANKITKAKMEICQLYCFHSFIKKIVPSVTWKTNQACAKLLNLEDLSLHFGLGSGLIMKQGLGKMSGVYSCAITDYRNSVESPPSTWGRGCTTTSGHYRRVHSLEIENKWNFFINIKR